MGGLLNFNNHGVLLLCVYKILLVFTIVTASELIRTTTLSNLPYSRIMLDAILKQLNYINIVKPKANAEKNNFCTWLLSLIIVYITLVW